MSSAPCQSCRRNEVAIVDPQDNPQYPYRLCKQCHQRLTNRCLRPLEYFNLKAVHGEVYLLHYDFYDDDGTADQPFYPVFQDQRLCFPKLSDFSSNVERILDLSFVKFFLDDEILEALSSFPKPEVLASLESRLRENEIHSIRIFEIVGKVLGSFAAEWVRNVALSEFANDDEGILTCAQMLSNCLPKEEGFQMCLDVLDRIESPMQLGESMPCLIHFRNQRALDWVEKNINRIESLSSSWGRVAAASHPDWPRIVKWLDQGRPLSLVALDTLYNCSTESDTPNAAPWFRRNVVKLLQPDEPQRMTEKLIAYLSTDNVPRTRNQIGFITGNWSRILKS